MAFVFADRVQETSTTTGTGTLSLDGASASNVQTFVSGIGTGNTCNYCIYDSSDWEVGIGTVTSGTPDTLSRDTILASSNSDAAVNFGAGTKTVLCVASAQYSLGVFESALLHVQDQKTAGTGGGDFNSGAWQTRDLNTVVTNEITGASLSANQITLPAGTYYIEASAPAYDVNRHKLKLRNVTDSSDTIIGTSEFCATAYNVQNLALVNGRFTIASSKAFELQHQCSSSETTGLGFGLFTDFGVVEVYSDVRIWKVA